VAALSERVLTLGYGWGAERPFLRVRDLFGDERPAMPLEGAVRWRLEPTRCCVGYFDGERGRPCPTRSIAQRGAHCEACLGRDAFRPCMTCDGTRCPRLSPAMKRYCRGDHHLYLACFGDEVVKVGTASHPRRDERVIEQGPLAAVRVARAPGPTIKQMERCLSAGAFTETMRRGRKTELLSGHMTEAMATQRVLDAAATLRAALPAWAHSSLHEPELVVQPAFARASRVIGVQPMQLADDVLIEGEVVGAVGHVLFVRDADGTFALDLGELKGRVLELDAGGGRRPVVQLGLF
jgi:hypothetical protein